MMKTTRSQWFVILGVLSLMGNFFAFVFNGITLLFIDAIQDMMQGDGFKQAMDDFFGSDFFKEPDMERIESVLAATPILSTIKFVASVGSFIGVYMLFKGRSQGFFWYLSAQLLEIVLPVMLLDALDFSWFQLALFLLFINVYYRESKRLLFIERQ